MMAAFAGIKVLHQFVADLQTCQIDDANEFIAAFPDLALSKP